MVESRPSTAGDTGKAIRVNRITVTACGRLQLFKTHLRMGNFLSRVFWELPHSVAAEREDGGLLAALSFLFSFGGFFLDRVRGHFVIFYFLFNKHSSETPAV